MPVLTGGRWDGPKFEFVVCTSPEIGFDEDAIGWDCYLVVDNFKHEGKPDALASAGEGVPAKAIQHLCDT